MSIILILLGILAFLILWSTGIYNQLVKLKALVEEAWSGIDVQLKRRYDLIPNLMETVKGYSIHEKEIFTQVAKMRSAAMNADNISEKAQAESGLTQVLHRLFAVAENYPQLKANENFLGLQKELSAIESEIQLSRRYYNGTARNYNIKVNTLPSNIIASISAFKPVSYFEISNVERETPRVKF